LRERIETYRTENPRQEFILMRKSS
jgi:hypothetical protein